MSREVVVEQPGELIPAAWRGHASHGGSGAPAARLAKRRSPDRCPLHTACVLNSQLFSQTQNP